MRILLAFVAMLFVPVILIAQNVGIGVVSPVHKLQVGGSVFVQSTLGGLKIGFNAADQWQFLTYSSGQDLGLLSSPDNGVGTPRLYITQAGNVGIGTVSPTTSRLDVVSTGSTNSFVGRSSETSTGIGIFNLGTFPTFGYNIALNSSGTYGYIGNGYGGIFQYNSTTGDLHYYSSTATGLAGNAVSGFTGSFFTLDAAGRLGLSTSTPTAKLHVNGNMVIGSSLIAPATGYSLSIDGKIICEEARVQNNAAWPDYVFTDDYKLMPISDLEKIIRKQKHLPNIPSAAEVDKDGIALGDMNRRLLEKVEELTLYIIQLSKENTTLAERITKLEKQ